jgi:c-di-AMP phosphodiesterase-like protein
MKKIFIEGNSIVDDLSLDLEFKRKLTSNVSWVDYNKSVGLNLNSINDFLRGGFGVYDYDENVEIIWSNSNVSRQKLDNIKASSKNNLFDEIIDLINSHKNIKLRLE